MKDIVKLGSILLVFCLISATSLAFTNEITKPEIKKAREEANEKNIRSVFSDADEFVAHDKLAELKEEYPELQDLLVAKKGGDNVGYVARIKSTGFGGDVEIIVGFDMDKKITGLRIGKHQETPGLGDKATQEPFYSQYEGMDLNKKIVVDKLQKGDNQILAISAATITSTAVTTGVNNLGEIIKGLEE